MDHGRWNNCQRSHIHFHLFWKSNTTASFLENLAKQCLCEFVNLHCFWSLFLREDRWKRFFFLFVKENLKFLFYFWKKIQFTQISLKFSAFCKWDCCTRITKRLIWKIKAFLIWSPKNMPLQLNWVKKVKLIKPTPIIRYIGSLTTMIMNRWPQSILHKIL